MSATRSDVIESVAEDTRSATSTSHNVSAVSTSDTRQRKHIEPLEVASETQDASNDEPEYPTGAKFYLTCLAISLVLVVGSLDCNIVATAVPAITDHFHTVADVGWYFAGYRLTSCSVQFIFGKLYKLFPVKHVFLSSTAVFLVGSVLCATAPSSKMFVFGRVITGLGAGGVVSGCFNLLVHICPLRRRPLITSLFGTVEVLSIVSAPMLGGILTERLSWRWCFWINLPLGGAAFVGIVFFLSDPRTPDNVTRTTREILSQLDLVGNIVLLPSLTCLFMALTWAGTTYAWNSPMIIGLLVAFAVLLGVFAVDQHVKQDAATIPPRILMNRNVLAGFFFILCLNATASVFEYYMPTYFQAVRGYSPARSGYMMLPLIVGTLMGLLICGSGSSIIGYYTPFAIVASVLTPIAAGLMTTWNLDTKLAELIIYPSLLGFAAAIGFTVPQTAVQTVLSTSDAPLGLAVIVFAQGFGPALFVSIAQTIFTNRLASNLHHLVPGLSVTDLSTMGYSELKASVGPANLDKILIGFHESLSQTWYLAVGLSCFTLIGSLALEWRSVKEKQG